QGADAGRVARRTWRRGGGPRPPAASAGRGRGGVRRRVLPGGGRGSAGLERDLGVLRDLAAAVVRRRIHGAAPHTAAGAPAAASLARRLRPGVRGHELSRRPHRAGIPVRQELVLLPPGVGARRLGGRARLRALRRAPHPRSPRAPGRPGAAGRAPLLVPAGGAAAAGGEDVAAGLVTAPRAAARTGCAGS